MLIGCNGGPVMPGGITLASAPVSTKDCFRKNLSVTKPWSPWSPSLFADCLVSLACTFACFIPKTAVIQAQGGGVILGFFLWFLC